MRGFALEAEPVCTWSMQVDRSVPIGETPEGLRAVGYLREGIVEGPRIAGVVKAGTADWTIMRRDGILRPNVNLLIETHDGATIMVSYDGFVDLGPDGYETRKRGERPALLHPRISMRMLTEAPAYAWVNRSPFVGVGLLEYREGRGLVSYDIYRITAPAFRESGTVRI